MIPVQGVMLGAIVAMGRVRADRFRFHLDRDGDFVQYAITRKRLLAGLGPANARQLQFFIAEEGVTAAAAKKRVVDVSGRQLLIHLRKRSVHRRARSYASPRHPHAGSDARDQHEDERGGA